MKIFNWIWSKKQETETYVVPQWESYTTKARRYNLDHGLPEDRLVGELMKLLKKLLTRKKTKQPEPFFEWVETPEEKSERLKQKYIK